MEDVAPFLIVVALVGGIAAFLVNRKEGEGELSTKDLPPGAGRLHVGELGGRILPNRE